jgi:hypothetical protein
MIVLGLKYFKKSPDFIPLLFVVLNPSSFSRRSLTDQGGNSSINYEISIYFVIINT